MLVEAIYDLLNLEFKNTTTIKSFTNIVADINRVKKGDLFLSFSSCDIKPAINKGAYGVVCLTGTKTTNQDIVYFLVKDIDRAFVQLVRYLLILNKNDIYLVNPIEYKILNQLTRKNDLNLAESRDTLLLFASSINSNIIISKDKIIKIIANKLKINKSSNIVTYNLFKTTFSHKNSLYKEQKIPSHYIDNLISCIDFLHLHNIKNLQKNFILNSMFEPIYINNNLQVTTNSLSAHTLIVQTDRFCFKKDVRYLNDNAKWAKVLFIIPEYISRFSKYIPNSLCFNEKFEIIRIMSNNKFNFCYIFGVDSKNICSMLKNNIKISKSLF
jgi:ferrochelatase